MLSKSVLIDALGKRTCILLTQRAIGNSQILRQGIKNHEPNNLEKRMLVWTGKYKNVAEVPSFVRYANYCFKILSKINSFGNFHSQDQMERCRNKIRIKLANVMMGLTVIGCAIMVYNGKQAAKRGESVTKQNLEWHNQLNQAANSNAAGSVTGK